MLHYRQCQISNICTAKNDMKIWLIIAIMHTFNLSSCDIKAWKKFRLERDLNPWPLQYRCSALPTELSSHWDLAILQVRNMPIEGKEYRWTLRNVIYLNCREWYEDIDNLQDNRNKCYIIDNVKFQIFALRRMIWRYDWSSQLCTHST